MKYTRSVEHKVVPICLWVVVILTFKLTLICGTKTTCSAVTDDDKLDCGYLGIGDVECKSKGCMWCKGTTPGVPWCFHRQKQSYNCTTFDNANKTDCHSDSYPSRATCERRQCLWCESKQQGEPWCFYSPNGIKTSVMPNTTFQYTATSLKTTDGFGATSTTFPDITKYTDSYTTVSITKSTDADRRKCPPLTVPVHARVTPHRCCVSPSPPKTECRITCRLGFKIIGNAKVKCLPGGTWDKDPSNRCLDIQPPNITCPSDKTVTLSATKTTAILKWERPVVQDNSGVLPNITHSLPVSTRRPEGVYTIWMSAVDDAGLASHCSFVISVLRRGGARIGKSTVRASHSSSSTIIALSVTAAIGFAGFITTLIFYIYKSRRRESLYSHDVMDYDNSAYDSNSQIHQL